MKVMPPERFEQLVFELAKREYPDVHRLQHPDGGADTLRPATQDRKAEVWQAKRYGDQVNWDECENSLRNAIRRWDPFRVIFAFPRDLSEQLERSFETRLVQHPHAKRAGVAVELWNLSEIVSRLDQHPELKPRFFGQEQDAVMAALDRAIKSGGQLESAADLVERAQTLSAYAEQQDLDFTYQVISSSGEAPAPQWPQAPYLEMHVAGPKGTVTVAAWPRQGTAITLPGFNFT